MTSPPGTINTLRTTNIFYTSSTSTARQLCKGKHSTKESHLCKAVEVTEEEETGVTEVKGSINQFDKDYWKDKKCFNCNKKGHPSTSLPEAEKDSDDASSSSQSSEANSVTKFTRDFNKM